MQTRRGWLLQATMVIAVTLLGGCLNSSGSGESVVNVKPDSVGTISKKSYDGTSDDLLTAGLGKTGLGAAAAPAPVNPTAPTAAELRRLTIFNNYRAVLDISPKGGYGTLYGPNIDPAGNDTLGEGKVSGNEYLAYLDDGTSRKNVTLMVQIPTTWDRNRPCIVTATSSGSRGVYGAIGSAGEWGLKRGCAVAYADKGTGMGVNDLASNTVNLQDGTRTTATGAYTQSNFTAQVNDLAGYLASFPNRIAVKHAHSEQNPEKDWGTDTLIAVQLALYLLNEEKGDKDPDGTVMRNYRANNTIVIASSISNGGAAAVAAAEQDSEGLIDGVAVAEPSLQLLPTPGLVVKRGNAIQGAARPLYDYFTYANLYQPCASRSSRAAGSFGIASVLPAPAIAANRCAALKTKGLLTKTTPAEQADEALDLLISAGWQPESTKLHGSHYILASPSIAMTYSYAYGRFSVRDNLCGSSFAATDAAGKPAPIAAAVLAQVFGTGNGVPPMSTISMIDNNSVGGAINMFLSVSASTGVQDYNVDGAICHRNLWTSTTDPWAQRVQEGVRKVLRNGNLRGKPAIIVAGREDALVPVNFNARPYYGLNKLVEGNASKLSYIEVTNAQHFDTFIDNPALPGYDTAFVPLHLYFIRAMDAVYANLTQNLPLPPSQVLRTTPRGGTPGSAPPITPANVPPIAQNPAPANQITFASNTVQIPD